MANTKSNEIHIKLIFNAHPSSNINGSVQLPTPAPYTRPYPVANHTAIRCPFHTFHPSSSTSARGYASIQHGAFS